MGGGRGEGEGVAVCGCVGVRRFVEVCGWWWCGRCAFVTCLSMPHSRMQLIRVAEHLGVKTPGVPATPSRPDGGGKPWPCACAQDPTNSLDLHNSDVYHLVEAKLWNFRGPQDHGKLPLRHDRDVNAIQRSSQQLQLWESDCLLTNGNCGTRTTNATGTSTSMCTATGESRWSAEQKSHGDQTHHDRGVDGLVDELQLRNVTRAPVVAHNGRTTWKNLHDTLSKNCNCGIAMVDKTIEMSLCDTTGMTTTISPHKCPSGPY